MTHLQDLLKGHFLTGDTRTSTQSSNTEGSASSQLPLMVSERVVKSNYTSSRVLIPAVAGTSLSLALQAFPSAL